MSVFDDWKQAEEYDACFARDDAGNPLGVKPRSEINGWDGWPEDVRDLLRHWNKQRRLSFRGGSFDWGRIGVQPRYSRGRLDFSQAVFRCFKCQAPCKTHPSGRAELDSRPYCDACLIELAREWQAGPVGAGKAFDDLTRILKKSDRELAWTLGYNEHTVARWLRGREPQAKDARKLYQLHAVVTVLANKLGEQEARHWVKERWQLITDVYELTNQAELLLFQRDTRRERRASSLADIAPGGLWWGDYEEDREVVSLPIVVRSVRRRR